MARILALHDSNIAPIVDLKELVCISTGSRTDRAAGQSQECWSRGVAEGKYPFSHQFLVCNLSGVCQSLGTTQRAPSGARGREVRGRRGNPRGRAGRHRCEQREAQRPGSAEQQQGECLNRDWGCRAVGAGAGSKERKAQSPSAGTGD